MTHFKQKAMDLQQFQNHGWKATDKVVYNGEILSVATVGLKTPCICAYFENDLIDCIWLYPEMFELYQPKLVHEAHTSLLTDIS